MVYLVWSAVALESNPPPPPPKPFPGRGRNQSIAASCTSARNPFPVWVKERLGPQGTFISIGVPLGNIAKNLQIDPDILAYSVYSYLWLGVLFSYIREINIGSLNQLHI